MKLLRLGVVVLKGGKIGKKLKKNNQLRGKLCEYKQNEMKNQLIQKCEQKI